MKELNRTIQRGDILYIIGDDEHPPVGNEIWSDRMALVVSNNSLNKRSGILEIVYLSTSETKRLAPTHIPIKSGNKIALTQCEQVHTVDISRVKEYVGKATEEEMDEVDGALLFSLGINRGKNPQGIFRKWENYLKKYGILSAAVQ